MTLAMNRQIPVWVETKLLHKEPTLSDIEAYKELVKTVNF